MFCKPGSLMGLPPSSSNSVLTSRLEYPLDNAFNVSTIIHMEISFDSTKSERNVSERGLPFTLVEELDWSSAVVEEDARKDYGEHRYQALGKIADRLHAVVFTPRANKVHVISLRKANQREVKDYEQKTKP
jgi:uncharacterized DUF497 family protein